jgi:2-iminobutanoate/2-iminopropanoate deaminase
MIQCSQAIKAGGMLYCSGCIGIDRELGAMVEGGVAAQARKVMENMKAIIEAGGCSMSRIVKCTVLLVDIADFAEVNVIYAEYFPENPPARACFAVKALPAGALVEIDCICLAD